jgi:hypothetical protein
MMVGGLLIHFVPFMCINCHKIPCDQRDKSDHSISKACSFLNHVNMDWANM